MKIHSTSKFIKQACFTCLLLLQLPLTMYAAYLPLACTNSTYESNIKTALMTQSGSYERFPAIDLNSNQQLNLQFDDMMPESDNYQFTFISAGDLMMIVVLRRLAGTGLLEEHPNLAAYVARGEARPAFQRAFAAQHALFVAGREAN